MKATPSRWCGRRKRVSIGSTTMGSPAAPGGGAHSTSGSMPSGSGSGAACARLRGSRPRGRGHQGGQGQIRGRERASRGQSYMSYTPGSFEVSTRWNRSQLAGFRVYALREASRPVGFGNKPPERVTGTHLLFWLWLRWLEMDEGALDGERPRLAPGNEHLACRELPLQCLRDARLMVWC